MALTQISTQGIKDGTITNADIGSSAAIARTKLANVDLVDDTSPQLGGNLDTNGNLVIFPDSNGTTNRLLFGTNKFQMYYNSGNSRMQIDNITGDFSIRNQASGGDIDIIAGDDIRIRPQGGENGINLVGNGAVELYHDNSKKFETTSSGAKLTGALEGDSDLLLRPAAGNNNVIMQPNSGAETLLKATVNGAVELYYDNSKKFETTSSGIQVTGQVYTDSAHVNGELDLVGNLDLNSDSHKIKLGAGDDFQLYHNGSNNYIFTNNGDIIMQTDGDDIQLLANDDIILKVQGGVETAINCVGNGAVELYHDNSKKFETFANGITVSSDNAQLEIESSSSGTSTAFGVFKGYRIVADVGRLAELQFINQRDNDVQAEIEVIANGDTNSYFDFKTSNAGLRSLRIHNTGTHLPDNFTANYGNSNDLQIYHDGSNSYIDDTATGNLVIRSNQINFDKYTGEALARFRADGNCELFHNNVSKFETTSSGVTISGTTIANGHIRVRDHTGTEDGQIMLGAGNDLRIYHNGAHSYLDNSTGSFFVRGDTIRGDTIKLRGKSADEDLIEAFVNGSVRLYHNNSIKLETTSSGVEVTGVLELAASSGSNPSINNADGGSGNNLYFNTGGSIRLVVQDNGHTRPASNNTYDLGTSNDRWRNIYTNDLNLSNEGGANDVDGTWGSYTIQEGAEDLFLINKRNGKKYKFNLTEVN